MGSKRPCTRTASPLGVQPERHDPQLTESFVFWRIAKGGPGLPKEGAPWNSAMLVRTC
jgi:hypothetical protein